MSKMLGDCIHVVQNFVTNISLKLATVHLTQIVTVNYLDEHVIQIIVQF